MFRIGKNFHLTHVVRDLDACDRWYDEVFSVQRFYRAYMKAAVRNASLVCIGDFVMEPVELARVQGADNSPIGKFLARFGERFHSMAWYVDSVADTYSTLSEHKFRLYDLVGNVASEGTRGAVWTHPKETHALLEFAEIGEFSIDLRLHPAWSSDFWRDRHPLKIERASHVTVLVSEVAAAEEVYGGPLGGTFLHREERPGERRSTFYLMGEDTVFELAQPLSGSSPEGRELEQMGEGISAVTFKTRDLAGAGEFLRSKGQRLDADGSGGFLIDRSQTFGMTVGFTGRAIPNDPR